jgi:hypothetical protein
MRALTFTAAVFGSTRGDMAAAAEASPRVLAVCLCVPLWRWSLTWNIKYQPPLVTKGTAR